MPGVPHPPVIFLAFASEVAGGYLPHLAEEARRLRAALRPAEDAGWVEIVVRQSVTLADILNVFQDPRYHGRIALFHFGGHADIEILLLQDAAGNPTSIAASGFAAFLAEQSGLQVVFLNACSTQPQVADLLAAGVQAVAATGIDIPDEWAAIFAERFYKGLGGGVGLAAAFRSAEAEVRAQVGDVDTWPWALTLRPDAEFILKWNLPDAVNDPYFGLPPLPANDLPAEPFRNILWFRREDAPVFFGRGSDIRKLYESATAPDAAPIVLFYGQSGVGKSSLLSAGLLPRLEQVHTVKYARRDQALGIFGTLSANVLGKTVASGDGPDTDLLARWRAVEAETIRPLTVILDQVEEVYTRPKESMPNEMGDFLDVLAALFGNPLTRPLGRLILSFRKDWLADVESSVNKRQLPCNKIFLERLDRSGIVEAVTGPASSKRLRQHFNLTVEDDLAGEIADDLRSDPGSAVAPTLQILLSKLWDQAKARNYDYPVFDHQLYHNLRRQGLLLSDFFDQQLAALRTVQPTAVDSGLALDLLAFHTTPFGTAEERTLTELRTTYAHQSMNLPSLLAACRDLYLLVEPADNRPDAEPASRLAHDTLVPLVRHRFRESDAPGQRARRILESRAVDWEDGKEGTPLDDTDLALVEAGKPGMRAWQPYEDGLIQASHTAKIQRTAERQRLRQERIDAESREQVEREARVAADARTEQEQKNSGKLRRRAVWAAVAAVTALILAVFATYLFNSARIARDDETIARATAEANEESAVIARATAQANEQVAIVAKATAEINEQEARIAEATAVVAQTEANAAKADVELLTRRIRADQLSANGLKVVNRNPPLALLLAVEGLRAQHDFTSTRPLISTHITYDFDRAAYVTTTMLITDAETVVGSAQSNVHEILGMVGGIPRTGLERYVTDMVFSPDGRWLATASQVNTALLWDVTDPTAAAIVLQGHTDLVDAVAFSPDGRWLVTASRDTTARLWNVTEPTADPIVLRGHEESVTAVAFSLDGRWLATASSDATARLWNVADPTINPIVLRGHEEAVTAVAFSLDGRWLATASSDDTARLWDVSDPAADSIILQGRNHNRYGIGSVVFSPNGRWLATTSAPAPGPAMPSEDTTASLWDMNDLTTEPTVLQGHKDFVNAVAFSSDGRWLATASLRGKFPLIASTDTTVRLWDMTDLATAPIVLQGNEKSFTAMAFSQDGHWLATVSTDKTARLWNVTDRTANPIVLTGHEDFVTTVSFSPDGRRLATASWDNTIRLWDVNDPGSDPIILQGHENTVTTVAFSLDGRWLATASSDTTARLWDMTSPDAAPIVLADHEETVTAVAFSPDGRWLATASVDFTVRLWDIADPIADPIVLAGHKYYVNFVAFSPDGRWLVTASSDDTAHLWDVTDLTAAPIVLAGHKGFVYSAAFSPDGRWLATASSDTTARLWDMTDPATDPIVLRGHEAEVRSVAFSPDGRWLATASDPEGRWLSRRFWGYTARLWDVTDPSAEPFVLQGHEGLVTAVAFSPDGRWLATASSDTTARLWDMADFTADSIVLGGHEDFVTAVAFSSDGRWLATASEDNTARLWDVTDPVANPIVMQGHADSVTDVAFSPNGRWLATASEDNTARLWALSVDDLIDVACRHAGRNFTAAEWQSYFQVPYRQTCEHWPIHPSATVAQ